MKLAGAFILIASLGLWSCKTPDSQSGLQSIEGVVPAGEATAGKKVIYMTEGDQPEGDAVQIIEKVCAPDCAVSGTKSWGEVKSALGQAGFTEAVPLLYKLINQETAQDFTPAARARIIGTIYKVFHPEEEVSDLEQLDSILGGEPANPEPEPAEIYTENSPNTDALDFTNMTGDWALSSFRGNVFSGDNVLCKSAYVQVDLEEQPAGTNCSLKYTFSSDSAQTVSVVLKNPNNGFTKTFQGWYNCVSGEFDICRYGLENMCADCGRMLRIVQGRMYSSTYAGAVWLPKVSSASSGNSRARCTEAMPRFFEGGDCCSATNFVNGHWYGREGGIPNTPGSGCPAGTRMVTQGGNSGSQYGDCRDPMPRFFEGGDCCVPNANARSCRDGKWYGREGGIPSRPGSGCPAGWRYFPDGSCP